MRQIHFVVHVCLLPKLLPNPRQLQVREIVKYMMPRMAQIFLATWFVVKENQLPRTMLLMRPMMAPVLLMIFIMRYLIETQ